MVQSLIFELVGKNLDQVDQCGFTLLHAACIVASEPLVRALIAKGANPLKESTQGDYNTPIDLVNEALEKRGHLLPILEAAVNKMSRSGGGDASPLSGGAAEHSGEHPSSIGIETIMKELDPICEHLLPTEADISDETKWKPQNHEQLTRAANIIEAYFQTEQPELRIQVAGSYAKKTAVGGKDADLDIAVLFPLDSGQYSAIHLARRVSDLCTRLARYAGEMKGESILCTARCVQFKLKVGRKAPVVDVDLLPAFDIQPDEFALLRPETRELVQASVDHLQVDFVKARVAKSPYCKALVQTAKKWRDQTADMLVRLRYGAKSEKKKQSFPRGLKLISYLVELVCMWVYDNAPDEDKTNLRALFAQFLAALRDIWNGSLHVFWTVNYDEEIIPSEWMLLRQTPVVVCPANPTNNVASSLRPKLWKYVPELATHTLHKLSLKVPILSVHQLSGKPNNRGSVPDWLLVIEKTYLKMQNSNVEAHMKLYHVVTTNSINLQGKIEKSISRRRVSPGTRGRLKDMAASTEKLKQIQFNAMETVFQQLDEEVPEHIRKSNVQLASSLKELRRAFLVADKLEIKEWKEFMRSTLKARTSATIGVHYLELGLEEDGLNRIWEAISIPAASIGVSLPPARRVYESLETAIGSKIASGEQDLKGLTVLLHFQRVIASSKRLAAATSETDVFPLTELFNQCYEEYQKCLQLAGRDRMQEFFLLAHSEAALELARWEVENENVNAVLDSVQKCADSSPAYKADWLFHWVHVLDIKKDDKERDLKCIDWLRSTCPLHPHFDSMFRVLVESCNAMGHTIVEEILQILASYTTEQGVPGQWPNDKWHQLLSDWESEIRPAEGHSVAESAAQGATMSASRLDRASTSATGL